MEHIPEEQAPRTCPECGAAIPKDAVFCTACGEPQPSACAACGRSLDPGLAFCVHCGHPTGATPTATIVVKAASPPAVPAPVPPAAPVAPAEVVASTPPVRGLGAPAVAGFGIIAAGAGLFLGWIRVPGMGIGGGAGPLDGSTRFRLADWLDTDIKVDGIATAIIVAAALIVLALHLTRRLQTRATAASLAALAAVLLAIGLGQLQYIADLRREFAGIRFRTDLGLLLVLGGAVFAFTLSLLTRAFDRR